jgi:hypothetical protein
MKFRNPAFALQRSWIQEAFDALGLATIIFE